MQTEAQAKTALAEYLLAVRAGKNPDGLVLFPTEINFDEEFSEAYEEMPLDPSEDDLKTFITAQLGVAAAIWLAQATKVHSYMLQLFLTLGAEYEQADPDADIDDFIRRQIPPPELRIV